MADSSGKSGAMDEHPEQDDDLPQRVTVSCAPQCRPDRAAAIDPQRIAAALRFLLTQHGCRCATLSVAVVDDATMTELHSRYLNLAEPTDVLTFDLSDGTESLEGEIVLCLDVAARESAARGHDLADEILLYAVHGCLHLLGYDDRTPADAKRMHSREDELLTMLGVGPVYRSATS